MIGLGHNQVSFDAVVEENLLRGLYLTQVDALVRCINDPRLAQRHRLVLAKIVERTNAKTGLAYPGRARLAADIVFYANGTPGRYTERTIGTTISELIDFGYLVAVKRAPECGGRALSHYAVTKPSIEELQAQIAAYCEQIRNQAKREFPRPDDNSRVVDKTGIAVTPDDDPPVAVRPPDDNPRVAEKAVVVDKAGVADSPSNDNPVVERVTGSKKEDSQRESPRTRASPSFTLDGRTVEVGAAFDAFWAAYPRKVGKGAAADTFGAIVSGKHKARRASVQELVDGARRYAGSDLPEEDRFIPHAATWLNQGRWADEIGAAGNPAADPQARLEFDAQLARVREEEESAAWR